MKRGKRVEEIEVGDSAEFSRKLSENDVRQFEGAIGDPGCSCAAGGLSCELTPKKAAVCEMLGAGLIHTALGSLLPGYGMRYLNQTLYFRQPLLVGDTITVKVTVTDKHEMSNWISLATVCRNQRGEIVTDGEATVMPPDR
jgi:acyl dehydratase